MKTNEMAGMRKSEMASIKENLEVELKNVALLPGFLYSKLP
jgi:hypothetical protein